MDDEKKPYECPDRNCTMSFVNKDHLDVHIRKHELSLTLTPSTPFKSMFVDETPTPTRFLNALESEVFQEFNSVNPFDATFRRANSSNGAAHTFLIPESSSLIASLPDSEDLNTPSITLPSESESPIILKRNFSKKRAEKEINCQTYNENTTDTLPFTPGEQSNLEETPQQNITAYTLSDGRTFLSSESVFVDEEPSSMHKAISPRINVVQTPVITSLRQSSVLKPSTTGVPTAVVVSRPSTNAVRNIAPTQATVVTENPSQVKIPEQPQAVVQSVCVTPMVQVMIRLPDGQTMPVQFPVMSAPTIATAPAPPTVPVPTATVVTQSAQSTTSVESQGPTSTSSTKMKLKEVLTMNQKTVNTTKGNPSNGKIRNKPHIQPMPPEDLLAEFGISPPSSPISVQRTGRKRREPSDDPDEKRRRSLERNRAAATRCREKRKVWITALERKAEELANTNTHLQHEVSQLRNEVAQLKTMLLAHKDCPVTLQQKGMSYETEKDSYTTVHIINSAPEDLQRVPNMVSPLNAEFMEVEISSVQSSSDASLTSDTSETSFKER